MAFRTLVDAFVALLFCCCSIQAQFDFYFSNKALNSGAINEVPEITMNVGESSELYVYYSLDGIGTSGIDAVAGVEVVSTSPTGLRLDAGETFDFGIFINDIEIDSRWDSTFGGYSGGGSAGPSKPDADGTLPICAFTLSGIGMVNPVFQEAGFDVVANSFIYAQVHFTAMQSGAYQLQMRTGPKGIINSGMSQDPFYGIASIVVNEPVILGDLNGDGLVTLLDISIFVDLLINGGFQLEGDMNQDGAIDLLDVSPLIDAIDFP